MGARVSSPRLVGRDGELARIRDAFGDAGGGRPRIVLVAGDAGIGKSRLIAEFLAGLDPLTSPVLIGGCLALSAGGLPYAPLTEALRRFVGERDPDDLEELLGPARSELARLLPALTSSAPRPEHVPAGRADQARLFELLLGLLGRLGRIGDPDAGAAALVVEDLQWVDDATRDLLTFLARNLVEERLLLLATYRTDAPEAPEWLPAWLAELERLPTVETIPLGPLSDDAVSAQLAAILGAAPAESLRRSIVARAGGNAFFAEELLAAGATGRAALPTTIREVLAARVRRLSAPATTVVRTLAIAGREIDEELLVEATGLSEAQAAAAVHEAIDRHVVVADPEGGAVALRHGLLQETIVGALLAGERRRLHERFAEVLVRRADLADPSPAGAAGELAHHWAAAGRVEEAFRAALEAARAADAVYAHGDALRHRRRALDLWPRLPPASRADPADRVRLLLETEASADLAGEEDVAVACIDEAIPLVDPSVDPRTAGILQGRLAYHRWLAGRSDEELAAYRRAVELVPAEPPSFERARVLRGLGGALMGKGRYRDSIDVCEQALAAARAAAAPIEEGRALDMLGMDLVGLGDIDAGIERLEEACRIARAHDPLDGLAVGLYNLGYHRMLADRLEAAMEAVREGISVVRSVGLDRRFGIGLRALGADILLRLGRWEDAEALVAEGRALDPAGQGSLYLRIVRLRLATARGRFDEARDVLRGAAALATGDVDYDLVAYLRVADAELAVAEGRPADAASATEAGLAAVAASDDIFLSAALATIGLRAAADRAEAARAWTEAASLAEAIAAGERLAAVVEDLGRRGPGTPATRGLAAARMTADAERGRLARRADPAAWEATADAWNAAGQPAPAAYARYREAESMLLAGASRPEAAEALAAAAATATTLGARPLLAAVMALARRARVALPSVASGAAEGGAIPEGPAPIGEAAGIASPDEDAASERTVARGRAAAGPRLSEREREVLGLVAAGRTNGEIARVLFISPKTASVHVSHILTKLGVANRVEAAMVAARLGLAADSAGPDDGRGLGRSAGGRATRTFLFTDMVRSTSLLEAIGDDAWADLRAWHDATLRALFTEHGGDEIDHAGDGFFVVFATAGPAMACAIAIQRALANHRRTAGFAPAVRIGLHAGEANRTDQGYAGRDVHLAARVAARAEGGEILASAAAFEGATVRPEAGLEPVELPGIREPVRIGRVGWQAPAMTRARASQARG